MLKNKTLVICGSVVVVAALLLLAISLDSSMTRNKYHKQLELQVELERAELETAKAKECPKVGRVFR